METKDALAALSALAQPTRLAAVQLLAKHAPDGLPAGTIAERLGAPANTMSTNLMILARAGLVTSERTGKQIIYRADLHCLAELKDFIPVAGAGGRNG